MDELLAWIVFPLAALAICFGIGALAGRIARVELDGTLLPAVGFAGAIAVLGIVFATGADAVIGLVFLVALAIAGFAREFHFRGEYRGSGETRGGWGAAAGIATYALHIAPVALTGSATFLGYNLLNDTAIHLALVDWIGEHGSRYIHQAPSSFGATINDYVESRYPLGSHELLAALKPIVGLDAAQLYQPFLAFCAGIAAAAIYSLLRRALSPPAAAVAAFAALASQLVFSFALQGSIKELAFIVCLTAAAGLGARARSAPLVALPAAALYGIYGVYALPWIVPLAIAVVILARPSIRQTAAGVAAFLVAIAVLVPDSIHYYNHGVDTITSGEELGPLAGPLKVIQVAGIWLNGDYRFFPNHSWLTYALSVALLAFAVFGLIRALRTRNATALLFVVPALVAYLATMPSASPYIDAKLLAILSPAVVAAAALGIGAIPRPSIAIAITLVLGGAILVSDALAYRIALPAPMARLDELKQIDKRFAGRGPMLVNEYEEYVKHFMRDSKGSDPYETWTAGRAELRNPDLRVAGHQYDLDQMTDDYVQRWKFIVLRHNPVQSRPPSNYDQVFQTDHYEVWQRRRPAPLVHVPLGTPPFDPTGVANCHNVQLLAREGRLVTAYRPKPIVTYISQLRQLPAGWYVYGQDREMLEIHKGGQLNILGKPTSGSLWLRGRTTRDDQLAGVPVPRELQRTTEWIRIDHGHLSYQTPFMRPKRSLRPGDAQPDIVGPFVAVLESQGRPIVRGDQVSSSCNSRADWIDVVSSKKPG